MGKIIALTILTFVGKVMSLHFNTLSRFAIAFLPRSKHLFISWLYSLSIVILKPKNMKSATVSTFSPSICHEVMRLDAMILGFWMLSFKPPLSPSSWSSLVPLHFLPLEWYHLHIWGYWYFSWRSWFQLHPAWDFTWCTKQGDNIQPWHTPSLILNQSIVPCLALTVASFPAYKFLKRQVR